MAEILLRASEIEQGALPDVCAVCGATDCIPVKTKLAVTVAEHGFMRTLRLQDAWLPFCQRHQWHLHRRTFYLFGFIACFVGTLPVMGCYAFTIGQLLSGTSFGLILALGLPLGMIATSFVLAAIGRRGNVQAGDITDQGVLVMNVSDRFASAVISARSAQQR